MPKSVICDMDGVIYRGNELIPGAAEFVEGLQSGGHKFLFLTNNSRHTPRDLKRRLDQLGINVSEDHFYTSGMATALFLQSQKANGSAFVIGDAGLTNALYDVGYSITEHSPDYVVVGETSSYNFELIVRAVRLIEGGARFIATNPDLVGPTELGNVPACGSLTAPIERATGIKPYFIGKPNSLMMRIALRTIDDHSENTVMVGDRMDTDIVAGMEAGLKTCLVLSGVTTMSMLDRFPYRPDMIADSVSDIDVSAL